MWSLMCLAITTYSFDYFTLLLDRIDWHICSAYLLCNTARFTVLHMRAAQFIQNFCFSRVHMAQDADNGCAKIIDRSLLFGCVTSFLWEIVIRINDLELPAEFLQKNND